MRRDDIAPDQKVVLCSSHFTTEDFKRDLKVNNSYNYFTFNYVYSFYKKNIKNIG